VANSVCTKNLVSPKRVSLNKPAGKIMAPPG
jgi:hypothetical protein